MVMVTSAPEVELMAADLEAGFPVTIWNGVQPPAARDQLQILAFFIRTARIMSGCIL
jgi:hypothetical protein